MYKLLLFTLPLFFVLSCKQKDAGAQTNEAMVMEGEAYGSTYRIVYYSYGKDWNNEIQNILEEFDHSVNTYIPNSVLSQYNASDYGIRGDRMLLELVRMSKTLNIKTNGYYDPSVSPLSNLWGFSSKGIKNLPSEQQVNSVMQFVGLSNVTIINDSLTKNNPRFELNFNAITGYVNDEVARFLNDKKVESYLIEIGGEMIAKGTKPSGDAWTIGIDEPLENPEERKLNSILTLTNEAMATSGNYRKYHIDKQTGQKIVHTINPKTGYPESSPLLSASVIASTCAEADATATALMAMGLETAKTYIAQRPDLKCYLIWSDEEGHLKNEALNGFTVISDMDQKK